MRRNEENKFKQKWTDWGNNKKKEMNRGKRDGERKGGKQNNSSSKKQIAKNQMNQHTHPSALITNRLFKHVLHPQEPLRGPQPQANAGVMFQINC